MAAIPDYPDHIAPIIKEHKTVGRMAKNNLAEPLDQVLGWMKQENLLAAFKMDKDEISRLTWALAGSLDAPTLDVLVKYGADPLYSQYPERANLSDRQTLHTLRSIADMAVIKGNVDVMKWYIDQGHLSVDTTDGNGNTFFQLAVEGEAFDGADWLLSRGANIDHQNLYGKSALHQSASEAALYSAVYLLLRGARADTQSAEECVPQQMVPTDGLDSLTHPELQTFSLDDFANLLDQAATAHEKGETYTVPADIVSLVSMSYAKEYQDEKGNGPSFPVQPIEPATARTVRMSF